MYFPKKLLDVANGCVFFNTKSHKKLYIFILSHPKNGSIVIDEILSRINYLDKMTRNVTFVMPGYKRATDNDEVCNVADPNLQLTFDENAFVNFVQNLEDESKGKFVYNDDCELLLVEKGTDDTYDFDNSVRLNLDELANKHVDAVRLIMLIAQNFRKSDGICYNLKGRIGDILKAHGPNMVTKVFIAGAKKLKNERALLREELGKVSNVKNVDIRSLTFEDFATYLTGEDGGRQADYNKFIKEEAAIVIFIFDTTAGEITEEEFNVAYSSFLKKKSPNIYVYVRKRHPVISRFFTDRRLQNIKDKVFSYHQEYYVEYHNLDDLRYKFYKDMLAYFGGK